MANARGWTAEIEVDLKRSVAHVYLTDGQLAGGGVTFGYEGHASPRALVERAKGMFRQLAEAEVAFAT